MPLLSATDLMVLAQQRATRNSKQARDDLIKLLKLRAAEIKPGGYFIAALGGRPAGATTRTGAEDGSLSATAQAMIAAIYAMASTGRLTQRQITAIDPPIHERSMDECNAALAELTNLWTVDPQFEQMIVHPAYAVLQENKVEAGGNKTK